MIVAVSYTLRTRMTKLSHEPLERIRNSEGSLVFSSSICVSAESKGKFRSPTSQRVYRRFDVIFFSHRKIEIVSNSYSVNYLKNISNIRIFRKKIWTEIVHLLAVFLYSFKSLTATGLGGVASVSRFSSSRMTSRTASRVSHRICLTMSCV